MIDTDKNGCRLIAECMSAYGVRHIVTSPGSRNAPLIMAFVRRKFFKVHSVVDERSAAFIALGIAEITGEPVAVVCTSGTAVLNYAPALAEAFYRNIPLIAISADRPVEWIDQNDSQTIHQSGILPEILRKSVDIKGEICAEDEIWYANRMLNDAMHAALFGVKGPIHINVSLSMPLTNTVSISDNDFLFHKIERIGCCDRVSMAQVRELAEYCHEKRILVVCTVNEPENKINRALGLLASLPNVAVIAEGISNVHAKDVHYACDVLFTSSAEEYSAMGLVPDLIISFGGPAVSVNLKKFLRDTNIAEHWHVGETDCAIDCFRKLTMRVEIAPEGFFPRFASAMAHTCKCHKTECGYAGIWHRYSDSKLREVRTYICGEGSHVWNAYLAMNRIMDGVPPEWNIQLSNGMTVRYAMACESIADRHRLNGNRGTSGIDGSVSTAVGASIAYKGITLLITGDMSMQYDIGALASNLVSPHIKIIVFNNGGGGIFKYVKTTRDLPEANSYFCCDTDLPMKKIADAYGFRYLCASDDKQLLDSLDKLQSINERPVILEIFTDAETDAEVFGRVCGNK